MQTALSALTTDYLKDMHNVPGSRSRAAMPSDTVLSNKFVLTSSRGYRLSTELMVPDPQMGL